MRFYVAFVGDSVFEHPLRPLPWCPILLSCASSWMRSRDVGGHVYISVSCRCGQFHILCFHLHRYRPTICLPLLCVGKTWSRRCFCCSRCSELLRIHACLCARWCLLWIFGLAYVILVHFEYSVFQRLWAIVKTDPESKIFTSDEQRQKFSEALQFIIAENECQLGATT